ncbi:MAG: 4'-phosphopantetheinyl transferase family protein [Candidatus Wenzhouxiangella sp. M2_3B_020]
MKLDTLEKRTLPLNRMPEIDSGEVQVWISRLKNLPVMETGTPARRSDRVRQLRMAQRFILRLLLGAYLGVPGRDVRIERGVHGKPALADASAQHDLTFNLSHAGDVLAVAIASGFEIGIDIEASDRAVRHAALARRWFGAVEADAIEALAEDGGRLEFLRRWSAREALIKARGEAIAHRIAEVGLSIDDAARPDNLPDDWPEPGRWRICEMTARDGLVGFVAGVDGPESVRGFELEMPGGVKSRFTV